ncbi:MAG: EamA family transporter [Bacteroidia bacterium]|nr:EamA family transporter [Bacteroidia bacterium]NNM16101.1 EamA family transporter [Bacteroidia bacterium]
MSIFIILSILSSSVLFLILKSLATWRINNFQGIVINYYTAALLSFLFSLDNNIENLHRLPEFAHVSIGIGFLFIIIFMVMALTTQKISIAITSVASKMSLVIPIVVSIMVYNEKVNAKIIAGIVLAVLSVYLVSKPRHAEKAKSMTWKLAMLPIILFIGSGVIDTAMKYSQQFVIPDGCRELFTATLFFTAAVFGTIKMLTDSKTRVNFGWRSVGAGVLLGIPNFFSIFFLLKALEYVPDKSAIVFSVNNTGIVLFSAVLAYFVFREKLSLVNMFGIAIAITSIFLLS